MISWWIPRVYFNSFSVLSTIPQKYLNEIRQYVFLSFQLFNLIITQDTRKISNGDLRKALLDHLSKSSTGLPSPPIPHQQPQPSWGSLLVTRKTIKPKETTSLLVAFALLTSAKQLVSIISLFKTLFSWVISCNYALCFQRKHSWSALYWFHTLNR